MDDLTIRKNARRKVVAIVALWASVMAAVAVFTGCYGHNCDGDLLVFGNLPSEGRLIDDNTWESGPLDGDWIPFPKQRVWVFQIPQLRDRPVVEMVPMLSAEENPNRDGTNGTLGAGNIAEQSSFGRGTVTLKNNTCADYFVRVLVRVEPRPPVAPTVDASTAQANADTDAGP